MVTVVLTGDGNPLNAHSGFTLGPESAMTGYMLAMGGNKQGGGIEGDDDVSTVHGGDSECIANAGLEIKLEMLEESQKQESRMVTATSDTVHIMSDGRVVPAVDVAREYITLQIQRLGLTEKDFGERVGIAQSTINDIRKGKRRAHFSHLDKINKSLGIRTSSMLKVMEGIAKQIEDGGGGYSPLPGRARGYILSDQKEAVKTAIRGLRRPPKKP